MAYPRLEIGEVEMSFTDGGDDTARMERVVRLTFACLQELTRPLQHLGSGSTIERLEVPTVEVSFETMDDETIARLSATEIYRALLRQL